MKTRVLFSVAIIISALAGWFYYRYQQPRTDLTGAYAIIKTNAVNFYDEYQANEPYADKKYLNKIVAVTGCVANVAKSRSSVNIQLKALEMGGINCRFINSDKNRLPKTGAVITVKGRCTGFLLDVNLVDCIITN